jgi:hypothetical protein
MEDNALFALDPPRFRKSRRPPIYLHQTKGRVWPLAAVNGREPIVLDAPDKPHGIELAYPRIHAEDAVDKCPSGTANGTATHIMPGMTPVLAIDGGEIVFAGREQHGLAIVIVHGFGWASYYANLEAVVAIRTDLFRSKPQYVRAGDVIGYVGAPTPGGLKRLYFELWRGADREFVAIDPRAELGKWSLKHRSDPFAPALPKMKEAA